MPGQKSGADVDDASRDDGSHAPPTPVPPAQRTGSYSAVTLSPLEIALEQMKEVVERMRVRSHRTENDLALQTARLSTMEQLVGSLPTALAPGSGAMKMLTDISRGLGEIRDELKADREAATARENSRTAGEALRLAAAAKAREPWSKVAWIAIAVTVSTIVAGALGAIGIFVGSHWRSDASPPAYQQQQPYAPAPPPH